MILTAEEVRELTHRDKPTVQARILAALGIPFRRHPVDGTLVVSRIAAEKALGAEVLEPPANEEFDVNVEALHKHGKTAHTR